MGHTPLPSRPSTPSVVHPHARGAYQLKWRFWTPYNGSSPHTWGIPLLGLRMLLPDRFIPTHVGHTQDRAGMSTPRSVHPHIRGAYLTTCTLALSPSGSSPHTWGILTATQTKTETARFIPTYVGHTFSMMPMQNSGAVHPHIRGAYVSKAVDVGGRFGSSPHTWGIQFGKGVPVNAERFIPTYVGHTSETPPPAAHISVHPHIRGAYVYEPVDRGIGNGSSPHTWGIRPAHGRKTQLTRFIPTYVGHTLDRRKKNGWFQPLLL